MTRTCPIGVFDSGYGGLTILKEIESHLPSYDYIYLGDNARAPYGSRSFESVYHYTLECVEWLFSKGCELVILACNTASAKALRTIQQNDLIRKYPGKRVLGVIRPTTEIIGNFSQSGHIGIMGTTGTILSDSYPIEIAKFFPKLKVFQQACPLWVPLIESNEHLGAGADYFVKKYTDALMQQSDKIDLILLACTHYPLLMHKISSLLPTGVHILTQGNIVATGLTDYLKRHPDIEMKCSLNQSINFFTTDSASEFDKQATTFFGKSVHSEHLDLSL